MSPARNRGPTKLWIDPRFSEHWYCHAQIQRAGTAFALEGGEEALYHDGIVRAFAISVYPDLNRFTYQQLLAVTIDALAAIIGMMQQPDCGTVAHQRRLESLFDQGHLLALAHEQLAI